MTAPKWDPRANLPFLSCCQQSWLARLEETGVPVVRLDGSRITDKRSFLCQAAVDLPGPEEGDEPDSWDAFADWLWEGLAEGHDDALIIAWTDVDTVLQADLPTLLTAADLMARMAEEVHAGEGGFPRPLALRVVLLGTGPMFPADPT